LSRLAGVSETQVEREPAGEILSERSESKDLLYPFPGVSETQSSGSPQAMSLALRGICSQEFAMILGYGEEAKD